MIKAIWLALARFLLNCPPPVRKAAATVMAEFLVWKYARLTVAGRENLPRADAGPYLFIANHLSNADALVIASVLKSYRPYFLAGVKLAGAVNSRLMLDAVNHIPINPGTADLHAIQKALQVIGTGNSLMIFPEGTRSRTARMNEGKKGIVLLAKLAGVPIVPLALAGTEDLCPINDTAMEKEFFQAADVTVRIGRPFRLAPPAPEEPKKTWEERNLRRLMVSIAEMLPPAYRGFYGTID
ncbi:MAG: lysophospholipid acyltransferase family protein [bacterium]